MYLSNTELKSIAPAIFSSERAGHLTDRYNMIHTDQVIDLMRGEGYEVTQAKQDAVKWSKHRDPAHVRHMVVMRSKGIEKSLRVGDAVPQLILTNSHNGTTKLKMRTGLYRFVCTNGMVSGRDSMAVELRHSSSLADEVIESARKFAAQSGALMGKIAAWERIELSEARMRDFANRAAILRFGESAGAYPLEQILQVRRVEDEGRSLWSVFNRVQENTVAQKLQGQNSNGRKITSAILAGITANIDYNAALWDLAEEVAAA